MKLYQNPASTNARRPRLTAAVLGIALDEVLVDLGKGEHKRPETLILSEGLQYFTLVPGPTSDAFRSDPCVVKGIDNLVDHL